MAAKITHKTTLSEATYLTDVQGRAASFRAEFGNSVQYRSGRGLSINFDELKRDWQRLKAEDDYRHRKPSYIRWLRVLIRECGSEEELQKLERFFDALEDLEPLKPEKEVEEPAW